ncbi:hypothetical protein [Malacoplasma iowae]|uniref:hypothetical protein n=1 Tax=Malacoplasma iowae TaxID=2116 RepID=UPI002A1892A3|nr:hypothetical protein [Malacoplasma iowae]WPL40265.1 hypothetical protein QX183_01775 [Malacoplasma iowae]
MKNINVNSTNKFNLIFRTTFLSENKKIKNTYNFSLYSLVTILFLFAIFLLVIIYSLNLTIDNFVKDLDTSVKIKLFGDIQKYSEWTSNTSLTYTNTGSNSGTSMNAVSIGGAVSLATTLGLSSLLSASLAMGFVSVAFCLITIIFKKRTIASFVSLGISFLLFIVVLTLFLILVIESSIYVKDFNTYGNAITNAINADIQSSDSSNTFTQTKQAFEKMKEFLEKLNK